MRDGAADIENWKVATTHEEHVREGRKGLADKAITDRLWGEIMGQDDMQDFYA